MKVILPSGDIKEFENSVNMFEVAKSISNSLAKKAVGAKVDGKEVDMSYILDRDAHVEIITPENFSSFLILTTIMSPPSINTLLFSNISNLKL